MDLCQQNDVYAFKTLSRLVIAFLLRSERLLISWLQSLSVVILEPYKIKPVSVSTVSPSICHGVMEPNAMIFIFWMLSFKPAFSLSSLTFTKRLFSFPPLSAVRMISSACLRLLTFLPAILVFPPQWTTVLSRVPLFATWRDMDTCNQWSEQ